MFLKRDTFRSVAWRKAVASLPCIHCGREEYIQAAHVNHREKGMGIKAPDCWTVPLCAVCHAEFDQGKSYTKQQRRELMDEWVILTIRDLAEKGLVKA